MASARIGHRSSDAPTLSSLTSINSLNTKTAGLLKQTRVPIKSDLDKLRARAGLPGFPITAYDGLSAAQVKSRVGDLTKADARKVRTYEKRHKNRAGVLTRIEGALKALGSR